MSEDVFPIVVKTNEGLFSLYFYAADRGVYSRKRGCADRGLPGRCVCHFYFSLK